MSRRHCKTANLDDVSNGLRVIITHYELLWEIVAKRYLKRCNFNLYSINQLTIAKSLNSLNTLQQPGERDIEIVYGNGVFLSGG